jgi:hypothetical protein
MTEEKRSGRHRTGGTDPMASRAGFHVHCRQGLLHHRGLFQRNHRERRTALPLYGLERRTRGAGAPDPIGPERTLIRLPS